MSQVPQMIVMRNTFPDFTNPTIIQGLFVKKFYRKAAERKQRWKKKSFDTPNAFLTCCSVQRISLKTPSVVSIGVKPIKSHPARFFS